MRQATELAKFNVEVVNFVAALNLVDQVAAM